MTDENKSADIHLYDLIYRDYLTELFNRRYFHEQIDRDSMTCKDREEPYSLIMFDIDHFKSINDGYGHEEGDNVLKKVSLAVKECLDDRGEVIRYAGDEFLVLLPARSRQEAMKIAWEIRNYVNMSPFRIKSTGTSLKLSISAGVATYPDDCQDLRQLINIADETAYLSKKKGRNTVTSIDEKENDEVDVRSLFRYFPCRHYFGREEMLRDLKHKAVPAPGENKPLTLIIGPAGSGKTRILSEIAHSLDPQRYLHLRFQSEPDTAAQPFCEVLDALNQRLKDESELTLSLSEKLTSDQLCLIVSLMPVFSPYCLNPPGFGKLSPQEKRDLLLSTLERIILSLATLAPLVVSIDDYQWSNLGTQMIIERVKSNTEGGHIPVFITVDEDYLKAHEDRDFLEYLERLERKGILEREHLEPLSPDVTRKLIASILPGLQEHKDILDMITEKSKGIPLYVENIVKHLVWKNMIHTEEGKLIVEEIPAGFIPENPGGLITSAAEELDEEVRELLCKASVIGERFSVEMLRKIDGRSEAYVDDLIARAEKADLISINPLSDPGNFIFNDNELLKSFYSSLETGDKQSYHLQLAELEKELHKDNIETVLAKIACHFRNGGDAEHAREYFSKLLTDYEKLLSPKIINLYVDRPPQDKDWGDEKELTSDEEGQALYVIKLIQVTMDNLSRFPLESEIVKGSLESSFWELRKLLDRTAPVSYADGDGELLINSRKPEIPDKEASCADDFLRIMARAGLKGMTFKKEVIREEFLDFLKMVISENKEEVEQNGGWTEYLAAKGIRTIITNERIFVALAERDLFEPKKLREETLVIKHPEREESDPAGKEKPLPEVPVELSGIIATLVEEIEKIREKIIAEGEWGDELEKIKSFLDKIFEKHGIIENLLYTLKPHIEELEKKAAATVENSGEGGPTTADLINLSRKIDLLTFSRMKLAPDALVKDLESKDDDEAGASAIALAGTGEEGVSVILGYLKSTDSILGRKRALQIARAIAPDIDRILTEELMGTARGEEKRRLLETLHDFSDIDISDSLRYFLRSPDADVRQAVLGLMLTRSTDGTKNLLLEILGERPGDENLPVIKDVIGALGKLKCREAREPLAHLIRKKTVFQHDPYPELQEAACLTLGKLGDSSIVSSLIKALKITSPLFLLRNKTSRVRAAAAYALSNFPTDEVRRVLRNASHDASTDVRTAATMALHYLDKTLPSKERRVLLGDALPSDERRALLDEAFPTPEQKK